MLRATLGAAYVMVTYGGGGGKTGHQLGQWRWSEKEESELPVVFCELCEQFSTFRWFEYIFLELKTER